MNTNTASLPQGIRWGRWLLVVAVAMILMLVAAGAAVQWVHHGADVSAVVDVDGEQFHFGSGPIEWMAVIVALVIAAVVLFFFVPLVLVIVAGFVLLILLGVLALPVLLIGLLLLPLLLPLWLLWKLLA
jgi:hypothetical protein